MPARCALVRCQIAYFRVPQNPLCVGGGALALIAAICIAVFIARKKRSPAAGDVKMNGVVMSATSEPNV